MVPAFFKLLAAIGGLFQTIAFGRDFGAASALLLVFATTLRMAPATSPKIAHTVHGSQFFKSLGAQA